MMQHLTGSERKHRVKIGDTSIRATTWIAWDYDNEPIDGSFDFGDFIANEEYKARFQSGELTSVTIKVGASWQDAEGDDFLGACHIVSKEMDEQILSTAEDHGMRMEALKRLQDQIITRARLYQFKGLEARA